MVMQEMRDKEKEGSEDLQYARTEEELYWKAIALLERCKIEAPQPGQEMSEASAETSPITV
jgi:hypothetical protein